MASLESIDRLLSIAARLLDHAAAEIRDIRLEPVRENVEKIGRALTDVFEIQHRIYALRPDLIPEFLGEPDQYSEANRLLAESMCRASDLERAGNIEAAIAELERFIAMESSELHRAIARASIKRLKQ